VHNLVDVSLSDSFITIHDSVTRGHSYKLIRQHCHVNARANFFINRDTAAWNSLPDEVVCCTDVVAFKRHLAGCDLSSYFMQHI